MCDEGVAQNAAHLLECPGVADGRGRRWEQIGMSRIWDEPELYELAKAGAEELFPPNPVTTEGGLKQQWKRWREAERKVAGTGGGRVVRCGRKARVNYVHCRTGKGNLQSWRAKLDDTGDPTCRTCGRHVETDKHVALLCPRGEEIGRRWGNWEEMDDRKRWLKKVKDEGDEYTVDLVETFFSNLDLA
ncbi:hypothetical protein EV426DRAFT_703220 [Tirmania nivea]|nr:hypothetical protein EV426DRAFT_703220 [Tirmania nivea]